MQIATMPTAHIYPEGGRKVENHELDMAIYKKKIWIFTEVLWQRNM